MLVKGERNLEWVVHKGDKLQLEDSLNRRSHFILLTYPFKNFSRRETNKILEEIFPGVNLAHKASRFSWRRG